MVRDGDAAARRKSGPAAASGGAARRIAVRALLIVTVGVGVWVVATPEQRARVAAVVERARAAVVERPSHVVRHVAVLGARMQSPASVAAAARSETGPSRALTIDIWAARRRVEALPWVRSAEVRLIGSNVLEVRVEERAAAALWRRRRALTLIDAQGGTIAPVASEAERRRLWSRLPLVIGDGAPAALGEAARLRVMAEEAGLVVVALTRIGGRRWDVEPADGPRIMLPAASPADALAVALAWIGRADLARRGVVALDLRIPHAPTARFAAVAGRDGDGASGEAVQ